MKMTCKAAFFVVATLALASGPAAAQQQRRPRTDQQMAHEGRRQGQLLPSREIERRVVPQMRGAEYLGFDFDSGTAIYTLKFLRNGNVIWVDVDGRSGRVIRRIDR